MRHRRIPFLLLVLLALPLGGAYCPNTSQLHDKVTGECRLAPVVPECAFADPDVQRYAIETALGDIIDDPFEEACVMDVDCSADRNDTGESQIELLECFRSGNGIARFGKLVNRGGVCFDACSLELAECGSGQTGCAPLGCGGSCDVITVDACFRQRNACREWCDLTLNAGSVRNTDAQQRAEDLRDQGL